MTQAMSTVLQHQSRGRDASSPVWTFRSRPYVWDRRHGDARSIRDPVCHRQKYELPDQVIQQDKLRPETSVGEHRSKSALECP